MEHSQDLEKCDSAVSLCSTAEGLSPIGGQYSRSIDRLEKCSSVSSASEKREKRASDAKAFDRLERTHSFSSVSDRLARRPSFSPAACTTNASSAPPPSCTTRPKSASWQGAKVSRALPKSSVLGRPRGSGTAGSPWQGSASSKIPSPHAATSPNVTATNPHLAGDILKGGSPYSRGTSGPLVHGSISLVHAVQRGGSPYSRRTSGAEVHGSISPSLLPKRGEVSPRAWGREEVETGQERASVQGMPTENAAEEGGTEEGCTGQERGTGQEGGTGQGGDIGREVKGSGSEKALACTSDEVQKEQGPGGRPAREQATGGTQSSGSAEGVRGGESWVAQGAEGEASDDARHGAHAGGCEAQSSIMIRGSPFFGIASPAALVSRLAVHVGALPAAKPQGSLPALPATEVAEPCSKNKESAAHSATQKSETGNEQIPGASSAAKVSHDALWVLLSAHSKTHGGPGALRGARRLLQPFMCHRIGLDAVAEGEDLENAPPVKETSTKTLTVFARSQSQAVGCSNSARASSPLCMQEKQMGGMQEPSGEKCRAPLVPRSQTDFLPLVSSLRTLSGKDMTMAAGIEQLGWPLCLGTNTPNHNVLAHETQ